MKNFKNSKTARVVSGFVGLAAAFVMVGPSLASADTSYVFTKTLKQGVTDQEVMNLQTVLNQSADTQVAASGVGSAGMESKYFGSKTKAAVIKFQEKYAADILTPNGLTKGTGVVGAATRAKLNAMGSMTTTTTGGMMSTVPGCTTTTGFSPLTGAPCSSMTTTSTGSMGTGTSAVSAMLDMSSPMAGSVIQGQAIANLGAFKFTNSGTGAAKVTSVQLKRLGISSDVELKNVYLYQGGVRLTDSASVASGMVTFSDPNGIVTIPGGSSIVVKVLADIDTAASNNAPTGSTIGMMLTGLTLDTGTAAGLPISAAIQTVAAVPQGIMTANFQGTVSPNGGSNDPQTGFVVWQSTLNIGSRDALLGLIRFQQIGSVNTSDIQNYQLFVDGTQLGSAVASLDSNRYVTFDFTNAPVTVKSGTHLVKLIADIVGGSNRNFQFSIRRAGDIGIMDSQLGVNVTATNGTNGNAGTSFLPVDTATGAGGYTPATPNNGAVSINSGSLTFTKTTDSPSGNTVLQGSNVTLGRFNVHAAGENMKVENLVVSFATNKAGTAKVRNGALYLNGTQIGSTQDLTVAGTQFNLGSSLIVVPGHDVVLEVRGDVFDTDAATQPFVANDTIQVSINAGTSNVLRESSLGYQGYPASNVAANQLTITSGSLSLSKYAAYANQTAVVPQTAYKIGQFSLSTGNTEGVNLNTITLNLAGTVTLTNLNNLYVTYGPTGGTMKTTQIKSTGAAAQSWSVNDVVPVNSNWTFNVYTDINANVTANQTIIPSLDVAGTGQNSGNTVDSTSIGGQTITAGTGAIVVALDASTPVSALAVGGTEPKVGSFRFTATNDSFIIDELDLGTTSLNGASVIAYYELKDGATSLKTQSVNSTSGTTSITGLSISVPANTVKTIDLYAMLGAVGTPGAATSSADVATKLNGYEYLNSTGVKTRTFAVQPQTNDLYVYKTKPTITNVALPTTVLAAGTQTIYQFTVTADAGGTVAWRQIKFNVASGTPAGSTFTNSAFKIYDSANQSTELAGTVGGCTISGNTLTCVSTQDQEIVGSKTYVLKATIGGTISTGASFSVNIPSSGLGFAAGNFAAPVQATAATFVWSDESVSPHSATTGDWYNDYLVKNLPTDSETMTK